MAEYNWSDLFNDLEELNYWMSQKPKWWQFLKYRRWKKMDPRKYWR